MRGRKPVYRDRFESAQLAGDTFYLSTIVLHELLLGVRRSARPGHQMSLVEHFRSGMVIQDWTENDAAEAAEIRARLIGQGTPIDLPDVLIAGQARCRGWSVVTANTKDFSRVDGLSLIDWDGQ